MRNTLGTTRGVRSLSSKQVVIGLGGTLIGLTLMGVLTRFGFSEALMFYPAVLFVACVPAAISILNPRLSIFIGWVTAVFSIVWAVLFVFLASGGVSTVGSLLVGVGGGALLLLSTIAQVVALVIRLAARDGVWRGQASALATQMATIGVVLAISLSSSPFASRFAHDQPQFDVAARKVMAGHRLVTPTRVGSFNVSHIETSTDDVTFTIGDDFTQVVFSPHGAPGTDDDGFSHLNGSWWLERQSD